MATTAMQILFAWCSTPNKLSLVKILSNTITIPIDWPKPNAFIILVLWGFSILWHCLHSGFVIGSVLRQYQTSNWEINYDLFHTHSFQVIKCVAQSSIKFHRIAYGINEPQTNDKTFIHHWLSRSMRKPVFVMQMWWHFRKKIEINKLFRIKKKPNELNTLTDTFYFLYTWIKRQAATIQWLVPDLNLNFHNVPELSETKKEYGFRNRSLTSKNLQQKQQQQHG